MKLLFSSLISMAIAMVTIEAAGYTEDPDFQVPRSIPMECGGEFGNWVVDVNIGTPGQTVPLRLDLGRTETWVATTQCRKEFCRKQKDNLFDISESSSIQNMGEVVKIRYGRNQRVKGNLKKDVFSLGNGIPTETKEFVAAYDVCKIPIQNFAGSFGLEPIPPPGFGLNTTTTLEKRGYSSTSYGAGRSYARRRKRDNSDKLCKLSYGIDPELFKGDLYWLPFPTCDYGDSPYWKTPLSCLKIDGVTDLKFRKGIAQFISVTEHIKLPRKYFDTFVEDINGTYDEETNELTIECCKAKDLTFSFKGYDITVPADAWTIQKSGKTCSALIAPNESNVPKNIIQIGTGVLNSIYTYYSVYRDSIGVALLNLDENDVKIVPT